MAVPFVNLLITISLVVWSRRYCGSSYPLLLFEEPVELLVIPDTFFFLPGSNLSIPATL